VLGQLTTATRSVHGCPSPHGAAERRGRGRVEDDATRHNRMRTRVGGKPSWLLGLGTLYAQDIWSEGEVPVRFGRRGVDNGECVYEFSAYTM
jgi:hypothetical protein